jgi:hypothetical protein
MPPRARAEKSVEKPAAKQPDDDVEKAAAAEPAKGDEICVRCWPTGWPSEDSSNASCVHGVWKR